MTGSTGCRNDYHLAAPNTTQHVNVAAIKPKARYRA
jgi:hypothetical protein